MRVTGNSPPASGRWGGCCVADEWHVCVTTRSTHPRQLPTEQPGVSWAACFDMRFFGAGCSRGNAPENFLVFCKKIFWRAGAHLVLQTPKRPQFLYDFFASIPPNFVLTSREGFSALKNARVGFSSCCSSLEKHTSAADPHSEFCEPRQTVLFGVGSWSQILGQSMLLFVWRTISPKHPAWICRAAAARAAPHVGGGGRGAWALGLRPGNWAGRLKTGPGRGPAQSGPKNWAGPRPGASGPRPGNWPGRLGRAFWTSG